MENEFTKTPTFFRFEDLRIYEKSLVYVTWVSDVTKMIPDESARDLISRFNAAAQAITIYIAEGSARNKIQFVSYLKMAKSVIRECVVYTTIASNQGYFTETLMDESRGQLMEMTKMIGALIGSLQRTNGNARHKEKAEENDDLQLNERMLSPKNSFFG
jgi:four helix bundle protein